MDNNHNDTTQTPGIEEAHSLPEEIVHQEQQEANTMENKSDSESNEEGIETTSNGGQDVQNSNLEKKISKNKYKKQMKAQKWPELKMMKKEKKKQEKDDKRAQRLLLEAETPIDIVEKPVKEHVTPYKTPQMLRLEYAEQSKLGQPVILDMQFIRQMESKEFKSLVKQLCYMQSANKKAEKPVRYVITSTTPELRAALYANNADKWGIDILDEHYLDLFKKEQLVYLTGDTDQDLDELDSEHAYIIGGLVDHNRLKNITLETAKAQGIAVKRFPISKYMKLETSSILACNHVFDILLQKVNGNSWKDSLMEAIPNRKIVATIQDGVEVKTEYHLKKIEASKIQQELKKQKKAERFEQLVIQSLHQSQQN